LGDKKYGEDGMDALRKAGQEHASEKEMQNIRAEYSKKEEPVKEGNDDTEIRPGMKVSQGTVVKVNGNTVTVKTSNGDTFDIFKTDVDIAHPDDKTKDTVFSKTGEQMYITLGDLAKILNKYVLLQDSSNKTPMSELSLTEGTHMENPGQPLLCLGSIFQLSTDPTICQIKNINWQNLESLGLTEAAKGTDTETLKRYENIK
jgi:hypothetical protein